MWEVKCELSSFGPVSFGSSFLSSLGSVLLCFIFLKKKKEKPTQNISIYFFLFFSYEGLESVGSVLFELSEVTTAWWLRATAAESQTSFLDFLSHAFWDIFSATWINLTCNNFMFNVMKHIFPKLQMVKKKCNHMQSET